MKILALAAAILSLAGCGRIEYSGAEMRQAVRLCASHRGVRTLHSRETRDIVTVTCMDKSLIRAPSVKAPL